VIGDFSFSHSLLTTHGCSALVATCYDSRSALLEKYPQATENIKEIEAEEEARLLYSVDATKLNKAGKAIKRGGFHRIVFNFPHVGGLTKDVNRQVRHNQGRWLDTGKLGAEVSRHTLICRCRIACWLLQVRAPVTDPKRSNRYHDLRR